MGNNRIHITKMEVQYLVANMWTNPLIINSRKVIYTKNENTVFYMLLLIIMFFQVST